MRVSIDTNVLVYASGHDDLEKQRLAASLLRRLDPSTIYVVTLAPGELHHVVSRRAGSKKTATDWVNRMAGLYGVADLTAAALPGALDLVDRHGFQAFDALILEQSALSDCSLLLTENGHQGFTWKGCTIVSPSADPLHPRLAAAIAANPH